MEYIDINDIRTAFEDALYFRDFQTDKTGVKTLELIGSSFVIRPIDVDHIFGAVNYDYVERELEWYKSQSLNVADIPGEAPEIWKKVADHDGMINSNYGYLIWSPENYSQYGNVVETLKKDPGSRRAIMIYTRPIMHYDFNRNGRSDFVCTNTVQYLVRKNRLNAVVNMRSNDAIFGFRNDLAWQKYVLERLSKELGIEVGDITWQTGSLHIYERHFYLVHHSYMSGESTITRTDFDSLYPESEW